MGACLSITGVSSGRAGVSSRHSEIPSGGPQEEITPGRAEKVEEEESEWAKFGGKELEEPIEKEWVRVLDSHYLVNLARGGGAVCRRQDMPKEAYLSLEELKMLRLPSKDIGGGGVVDSDEQTWLPLVILSYPWLTPAHPDPEGETLAVVAQALENLGNLYGVIIDFTALPQVPRNESEETNFRSGLKSLNLFYTHPYVVVFKVTEFPSGYPTAQKYKLGKDFTPIQYEQRGWCYAESCMASLGCKPKLVCDVSHCGRRVLGSNAARTPAPLTPADFNQVLSTKTFTQAKTDTQRVQNLYLAAFTLRIQNAKALRFADLQWGAVEVRGLAKVLESNRQAESLDLSSNTLGVDGAKVVAEVFNTRNVLTLALRKCDLGDGGASEIAEALKVNSALTTLNLLLNRIGAKGARALGEALKVNRALTTLNLEYNWIGAEGARALGEALKVNSALTTLNLRLNRNRIGAEGARALGEALKVNSALTTLDLTLNEIGTEGSRALGEALKVNSALTTLNLWENKIGTEGARALGEALKVNRALTTLNLSQNEIGAEGARALGEALKVNSALTTLNLIGNPIGAKGVRALGKAKAARPGCKLGYDDD